LQPFGYKSNALTTRLPVGLYMVGLYMVGLYMVGLYMVGLYMVN
jgi:hypothetical protein